MDGNHVEHVSQNVRLIACPNLALEHGKIDRYVPEGGTVAEHLRALGWQTEGLNARVFIDGEFIEQAQWEYAVPRAGQSFVSRVIPMGGGEGGKQAMRIVAMLVIVAAAMYTGNAAAASMGMTMLNGAGQTILTMAGQSAAHMITASLTIAGMLMMNSLVPAPLPRRPLPLSVQEGLKVAA